MSDLSEIRPASDALLTNLRDVLGQIQAHEHPRRGGDLFCLNLTSYMGERMGPVLRRLADEQAARWRAVWSVQAAAADLASLGDDLDAVRTERDALAEKADAFELVPCVFVHGCGHTERWNEGVLGSINEQGCDACESAPDGSWRPVYARRAGAR